MLDPRVLWVVAALIAAAITGIALLPHHKTRNDVAQYILRVDAAGTTFAKQSRAVSSTLRSLGSQKSSPEQKSVDLRHAARQLTILRQKIARIPAPQQAGVLRKRLIAYYKAQEAVAYELAGITAYFPKLRGVEAPVTKAGTTLRAELKSARKPAEQEAALEAYEGMLRQVSARVAAVPAPAGLTKARDEESKRLAAIAGSVRRVRAALHANDRAALDRALRSLDTGGGNTAALAARAAVVAYNRHLARIAALGARAEKERRRLQAAL